MFGEFSKPNIKWHRNNCCNDGTKDNSQKIIDKYVKKYPDKVKSFIKENGGQGSARNYGLKQC